MGTNGFPRHADRSGRSPSPRSAAAGLPRWTTGQAPVATRCVGGLDKGRPPRGCSRGAGLGTRRVCTVTPAVRWLPRARVPPLRASAPRPPRLGAGPPRWRTVGVAAPRDGGWMSTRPRSIMGGPLGDSLVRTSGLPASATCLGTRVQWMRGGRSSPSRRPHGRRGSNGRPSTARPGGGWLAGRGPHGCPPGWWAGARGATRAGGFGHGKQPRRGLSRSAPARPCPRRRRPCSTGMVGGARRRVQARAAACPHRAGAHRRRGATPWWSPRGRRAGSSTS